MCQSFLVHLYRYPDYFPSITSLELSLNTPPNKIRRLLYSLISKFDVRQSLLEGHEVHWNRAWLSVACTRDDVVQHVHPNARLVRGARPELVDRVGGHIDQLEGVGVLLSVHLLHVPPVQWTHLARFPLKVRSFVSEMIKIESIKEVTNN